LSAIIVPTATEGVIEYMTLVGEAYGLSTLLTLNRTLEFGWILGVVLEKAVGDAAEKVQGEGIARVADTTLELVTKPRIVPRRLPLYPKLIPG
jgi:hypothetical protein